VEGTTYYYVTQSDNGCESDPDIISIFMEFCEVVLEMPNVITADANNVNDLFHPVKLENITEMHTTILNRWGEVLYETDDININWSANDLSGNSVTDGTYFYIIKMVDRYGNESQIHGNIQVIR